MDKINEDETLDEIRGVRIIQKKKGYRFSVDSLLLADFPDLHGIKKAIDLGTGSGIIAILLAKRSEEMTVKGVELQNGLFEMARRNVELSSLSDRVEIIKGDLRTLKDRVDGGSFDLVVCNPPYHPVGRGRIGPNVERTVARHEVAVTLTDVINISEYLLKDGGKAVLVYPAKRLKEIFSIMRRFKIGPRRFKEVHTKDVELIIAEGKKGYEGECAEEVPLRL